MHSFLFGKPHLVLGGMDIDIHTVIRNLNKHNRHRELSFHQSPAVSFKQGGQLVSHYRVGMIRDDDAGEVSRASVLGLPPYLLHHPQAIAELRDFLLSTELTEGRSLDELKSHERDVVKLAEVVDVDDAGVFESGDAPCLMIEATAEGVRLWSAPESRRVEEL